MAKTVTFATRSTFAVDTSILRGIFMPLGAMRLVSLPLTRIGKVATRHIGAVGDSFQMARSYAISCATKMVNFGTGWNWPVDRFVGPLVGTDVIPAVVGPRADFEHAIPVRVDKGSPQPTVIRLLDFRPEAFGNRDTFLKRGTSRHVRSIPAPS